VPARREARNGLTVNCILAMETDSEKKIPVTCRAPRIRLREKLYSAAKHVRTCDFYKRRQCRKCSIFRRRRAALNLVRFSPVSIRVSANLDRATSRAMLDVAPRFAPEGKEGMIPISERGCACPIIVSDHRKLLFFFGILHSCSSLGEESRNRSLLSSRRGYSSDILGGNDPDPAVYILDSCVILAIRIRGDRAGHHSVASLASRINSLICPPVKLFHPFHSVLCSLAAFSYSSRIGRLSCCTAVGRRSLRIVYRATFR